MIQKPVNETLPASDATAALISLPATQECTSWIIQARGSVDMKISDVSAMTTYFTIKSGTQARIDIVLGKGAKCFYAISGGAESVVELLPVLI